MTSLYSHFCHHIYVDTHFSTSSNSYSVKPKAYSKFFVWIFFGFHWGPIKWTTNSFRWIIFLYLVTTASRIIFIIYICWLFILFGFIALRNFLCSIPHFLLTRLFASHLTRYSWFIAKLDKPPIHILAAAGLMAVS